MTVLTITYSSEAGTLLEGTSRGDGSAEVVKALRWRWGRSIGCWYVPRSRFAPPNRARISEAGAALEAAGFSVVAEVEASTPDPVAAEAVRVERDQERAERMHERANRHAESAVEHYERSRALADRIPFGQPILVGHHSQARAERDASRIRRDMDLAVTHSESAEETREAARSAAGAEARRHRPVTVANRIERLSAEARSYERELSELEARDSTQTGYGVSLREKLGHTEAQLTYWQDVRAEQIRAGQATNYSRDVVRPGDKVQIRGRWYEVARANAKTVSVVTEYTWTDKSPWYEVQDHRAAT